MILFRSDGSFVSHPGPSAAARTLMAVTWSMLVAASTAVAAVSAGADTTALAQLVPAPAAVSNAAPLPDEALFRLPTPAASVRTNASAPALSSYNTGASLSGTNAFPASLLDALRETNGMPPATLSPQELAVYCARRLELARYLRTTRQAQEAEPILIELMKDSCPKPIQQSALLELAAVAQDENEPLRAEQIYAQFLSQWPEDLRVPEVLLRQGLIFRDLSLPHLALSKFYSVMTSALVLKSDQLDYYVRLVLRAQSEIAETQYLLGQYAEAEDFFSRLLRQNNPDVDRAQIVYKLTRCHAALKQYGEVVSNAQDFLAHYPDAPEQPEIRFYLAQALKELGRNNESLQQVLLLLQEQRAHTLDRPEQWTYWQQRAGNLIANQLYREGDYARALTIYLGLVPLDPSPQWQLPVDYQVGMVYERLAQPQKAVETYRAILSRETQLGTNTSPSLINLFDMARWRIHFIQWQQKAEAANLGLRTAATADTPASARLPATPAAFP